MVKSEMFKSIKECASYIVREELIRDSSMENLKYLIGKNTM